MHQDAAGCTGMRGKADTRSEPHLMIAAIETSNEITLVCKIERKVRAGKRSSSYLISYLDSGFRLKL